MSNRCSQKASQGRRIPIMGEKSACSLLKGIPRHGFGSTILRIPWIEWSISISLKYGYVSFVTINIIISMKSECL